MSKTLNDIAYDAYREAYMRETIMGAPAHKKSIEACAKAVAERCAEVLRERWEQHITDGKDIKFVYEATQCELAIRSLINGGEDA